MVGSAPSNSLVVRRGACSGERSAALSWSAWARTSTTRCAELWIVEPSSRATLRSSTQLHPSTEETDTFRRASGGAEVATGPGVLHTLLLLPQLSLLEAVRTDVILNRLVRPLLRAISRSGALAHYFGRDWISAKHQPVAQVAFAHDAATQRTLIEAFVSVNQSACPRVRSSYLGREPTTLAQLVGRELMTSEVADKIERSYLEAYGLTRAEETLPSDVVTEPAPKRPTEWSCVHEEAIGPLGIGIDEGGHLRLGGELMISFDALSRLESELDALGAERRDRTKVERIVEAAWGASDVALFGVQSLDHVVSLVVDDAVSNGAGPSPTPAR